MPLRGAGSRMGDRRGRAGFVSLALLCAGWALVVPVAAAPDSPRLARAKEDIADEHWGRAIRTLRAAMEDPKEPAPDEVRFWLAHSLSHAGDSGAALETIDDLERRYPGSRWVRPARALRIEIARRLRRDDLLWHVVAAPPPPPRPPAVSAAPSPPAPPAPPAPRVAPPPLSDVDLRIQALSTLMRSHAEQVIPVLKAMVFELGGGSEARRALFVLAQSDRVDARAVLIEVARRGPESVRTAAVRELGRRPDPEVTRDLLVLYRDSPHEVRRQIVQALARLRRADALARIAREESQADLRDSAIVLLGLAGGRDELRALYGSVAREAKAAVVTALFNAAADDELIEIARTDADREVRRLAVDRLRLLDTEKARLFLATVK